MSLELKDWFTIFALCISAAGVWLAYRKFRIDTRPKQPVLRVELILLPEAALHHAATGDRETVPFYMGRAFVEFGKASLTQAVFMFHHEENGDTDFIPGYFVDPKVDYHQAIASNVLPSQNQPSLGESEGVEIRVHPKAVKRFNELVDTATTLVLQIDIMGRPRMESQEVQLKKTFQEFQVHPDIDKSESA